MQVLCNEVQHANDEYISLRIYGNCELPFSSGGQWTLMYIPFLNIYPMVSTAARTTPPWVEGFNLL